MIADQPPRPANMNTIVAINQGRIEPGPDDPQAPALDPDEVDTRVAAGAIALDVRAFDAFDAAHLGGSIHVSATSSSFEQYVGWIAPPDGPLVLVVDDPGAARSAVRRLAFVGLDRRVVGHVTPAAWTASGRSLIATPALDVGHVRASVARGAMHVLDVREADEYAEGHVPAARHVSFKLLPSELERLDLPRDVPLAVLCAGGLRSAIACSVLRRAGWPEARNVAGGMGAWVRAGYPIARSGSG